MGSQHLYKNFTSILGGRAAEGERNMKITLICILEIKFCGWKVERKGSGSRQILHCFFHSCTVHLDTVESFIYPTDAQPDCSKRMLKFTLKFT